MITPAEAERLLKYLVQTPDGIACLTNASFRSANVREYQILGMPFAKETGSVSVGGIDRWCHFVNEKLLENYANGIERIL